MPNWREPFSDVSNIATCNICHHKRRIVKIANTELVPNCMCNMAMKLECGHIFVDDCESGMRNGRCFENESQWHKEVCPLGHDREWNPKTKTFDGRPYDS